MIKFRSHHRISCAGCSVGHLCLVKDLDKTELEELNTAIPHVKIAKKGEHLFHARDSMQYLYAVYSGSCKDYVLDAKDNECINNFYFPGDLVGLESIPNKKHLYSLVALEDTQLCLISITSLFDIMNKNGRILKRVMNIHSYKMQNDLHVNVTSNATQRVIDFILNIFRRLDERQIQHEKTGLPISQLDISHFLGITHETVNRVIKKLVKEKIIEIKNKKIYIAKIDQLQTMGTPIVEIGQDHLSD